MARDSRIIITRHGQSEHNPRAEHDKDGNYSIHDPPLTALGKMQAEFLASPLVELERNASSASLSTESQKGTPQVHLLPELQQEADLIITSPLKRTLQTTLIGWAPAIERLGLKNVICLPEAQECNDYPCDTGSSREELEKDPEFAGLNFELLEPDWNSKQGVWSPDVDAVTQRAMWIRQYLYERKEKTIVFVGHGDLIRRIIGSPTGKSKAHWQNAEVRIFEFYPEAVITPERWLHETTFVAAGFK